MRKKPNKHTKEAIRELEDNKGKTFNSLDEMLKNFKKSGKKKK